MTAEMILTRMEECGIPCTAETAERLCTYHTLLMDWNTRMDLTAVTEEPEMLDRHYVDSLAPLRIPGLIPESGSLIDVGTGAGLPGLPLAIACPGLRVTLLDAQQKRLTFLAEVVRQLGLTNVSLVHARAEDGGRNPALRERFDLATTRAVAPMSVLCEYLLPFVRTGGKALCWKGPALQQEWEVGRRAAHLLGGKTHEPVPCEIPGRDWQHTLLAVDKVSPTPRMYPRKAGTPKTSPLG